MKTILKNLKFNALGNKDLENTREDAIYKTESKIDENSCVFKLNTITFYENISYCTDCGFHHR